MRLLTRYILFEIIKVFFITLTAMTLFMILVSVSKEAYQQGLGLKQILLLLPYVLPEALRFSVPGTILFATCSVYGRMASTNEIVAIKAMGISPLSILWPLFVFSFLLSLAAVVLNDMACSWGRDGTRRVVIESLEEIVYSRLTQQKAYNSKQFTINVKRVDGQRLIRPTFTITTSDDGAPMTIVCEEAELRSDFENDTLAIVCTNGTVDVGNARAVFHDTRTWSIALDEGSRRSTRGASDLAMSQVPQEVQASNDRIDEQQRKLALLAGEQMTMGDFSSLSGGQWASDERRLVEERVRLYRLLIEPSRRWANGFSCLCFVLLGAPAGILLRNSDLLSSFFACFFPILIIYYPLLFLGVNEAKLGILPPCSVWIGNVILALAGGWLIRRVYRY